jgi:hypothetical protein
LLLELAPECPALDDPEVFARQEIQLYSGPAAALPEAVSRTRRLT